MYCYEKQDLDDLHQTLFEMLIAFDKICRENDIHWVLLYGSAIGALRHQGFIPWDDDVDIGMMREDYAKFKEVLSKYNKEDDSLMLVDARSDAYYHDKIFPRLYKKGTIFETVNLHNMTSNKESEKCPIWIDIFLFDYVDSQACAEKKIPKTLSLHRKYIYSKYNMPFIKGAGLIKNSKILIKKFYHWYAKHRWTLEEVMNEYELLVREPKAKDYILTYDTWEPIDIKKSFIKYDDCFPEKRVSFRGVEFPVFKNCDIHLKKAYGNYMELPPEEKRVNHPPRILDFGDGKGNRII